MQILHHPRFYALLFVHHSKLSNPPHRARPGPFILYSCHQYNYMPSSLLHFIFSMINDSVLLKPAKAVFFFPILSSSIFIFSVVRSLIYSTFDSQVYSLLLYLLLLYFNNVCTMVYNILMLTGHLYCFASHYTHAPEM